MARAPSKTFVMLTLCFLSLFLTSVAVSGPLIEISGRKWYKLGLGAREALPLVRHWKSRKDTEFDIELEAEMRKYCNPNGASAISSGNLKLYIYVLLQSLMMEEDFCKPLNDATKQTATIHTVYKMFSWACEPLGFTEDAIKAVILATTNWPIIDFYHRPLIQSGFTQKWITEFEGDWGMDLKYSNAIYWFALRFKDYRNFDDIKWSNLKSNPNLKEKLQKKTMQFALLQTIIPRYEEELTKSKPQTPIPKSSNFSCKKHLKKNWETYIGLALLLTASGVTIYKNWDWILGKTTTPSTSITAEWSSSTTDSSTPPHIILFAVIFGIIAIGACYLIYHRVSTSRHKHTKRKKKRKTKRRGTGKRESRRGTRRSPPRQATEQSGGEDYSQTLSQATSQSASSSSAAAPNVVDYVTSSVIHGTGEGQDQSSVPDTSFVNRQLDTGANTQGPSSSSASSVAKQNQAKSPRRPPRSPRSGSPKSPRGYKKRSPRSPSK